MTPPSTRPGTPTISRTRRRPAGVDAEVHDQVDGTPATVGTHERRRDVLAGQQRQRAHLHQRLAGRVGVHACTSPAGRSSARCSRSRHSACRTSPTTSRSGRIRSASLTSRRSGDLAGRPPGSAAGSAWRPSRGSRDAARRPPRTVISRSPRRDRAEQAFSSVVFPACVPPETRMLSPAATAASRKRAAAAAVSVPSRTRSSSRRAPAATNFRTLTARCRRVTSGITDVQPGAVRQGRVDERARSGRAAARWSAASARPGRATSRGGEHGGGQLAAAAPGDEDLARLVDPDLLDLRVVQPALQRPEAGDRVEHVPGRPAAGRPPAAATEDSDPRASSRRAPRRPARGRRPGACTGSSPRRRTSSRTSASMVSAAVSMRRLYPYVRVCATTAATVHATCRCRGSRGSHRPQPCARYSRSRPRLMIVFWISVVPSPISRNGASRNSRSISYSLE